MEMVISHKQWKYLQEPDRIQIVILLLRGGVLGTMMGYSKIPEYWMKGLKGAEDKVFKYTSLSLNQTYQISYKHALEMIQKTMEK